MCYRGILLQAVNKQVSVFGCRFASLVTICCANMDIGIQRNLLISPVIPASVSLPFEFVGCIFSLIKNGKGTTVVNLIKDISSNYRNISQDPVVYCLALCARSDDVTTKRAAYEILNDVCRIPTHLFQVCYVRSRYKG